MTKARGKKHSWDGLLSPHAFDSRIWLEIQDSSHKLARARPESDLVFCVCVLALCQVCLHPSERLCFSSGVRIPSRRPGWSRVESNITPTCRCAHTDESCEIKDV